VTIEGTQVHRLLGAAALVPFALALAVPVRAEDRDAEYRREAARAHQLLDSGHAKEAIEAFDKANKLAGKKSAECFLGLSLAHMRIQEFKDAEKDAQKSVEHASTSHEKAEGLYFLGSALMGQDDGDGKKTAEGIPELRRAVEMEPVNATYRYQLGLALLRTSDEDAAVAELQRFLELAPGSSQAEQVRGFIEYPPRALVDYAPEFDVVTTSGREISLVNQRGRVLLIDFWATWCPPCVNSVPWLKRLQADHSDDPFTLLSVSVDEDPAAWTKFIQEKEMSWEHVRGTHKTIRAQFLPQEFVIPTYFVIDGRGVIRGRFFGDDRRSMSRLESTLDDCLEELRPR
jgi:tetratricopeptide (TPR) repeat protein